MSIRIEIKLTKPTRTYLGGETIYGRVLIYNEAGMVQNLFNRLFLVFYGGATTNLKGSRIRRGIRIVSQSSLLRFSNHRHSDDETIGQEFYLNKRLYLNLRPGQENSNEVLLGTNVIPFEFQLPPNLPSSFSGPHGIISYDISISFRLLQIPEQISSKVDFQVTRIVDLNYLDPVLIVPRTILFDKFVWIGSAQYGHGKTLKISVKMPTQCYIPDEYLQCSILLQNLSARIKIKQIRLEFVQEIHCKAPIGSMTDCHVLANFVKLGNNICESEEASCSLHLPRKLVPSTSAWPAGSSEVPLISISYSLLIKCSFFATQARTESLVKVGKVPIIIGTAPIRPHAVALESSESVPPYPYCYLSYDGRIAGRNSRYGFYQRPPPSFMSIQRLNSLDDEPEEEELPPPTYDEAMEMIRKNSIWSKSVIDDKVE